MPGRTFLIDKLSQNYQHFPFPRAVKFAKKNSLPSSQKQFSVLERNGNARTDQTRFDMRVGIVLEMAKAFVKLRNRVFQKKEHITFHVRVGIFVDG
jgi:hypothetical protein